MGFFRDYKSGLRAEFSGYNGKKLKKDIFAGITTGAVALPLAIAFGTSSGADASAGLITAIVAAFVIGALSGASFQIPGPTGAMVAVLAPLAMHHGLNAVFAAGVLGGVLLIVFGLLKIGKIVNLLPTAVIYGFTSGIALFIALGQVENLLGVTAEGEGVIQKIWDMLLDRPAVNLTALLIGVLVAVFIFAWPKKLDKAVPGSLVAVVLAAAAQLVFKFPVATVGEIPRTLISETRLDASAFLDGAVWEIIWLPGLSIAMLCLIESLLCGVVGGRMKGETLNADREIIAQGIGNIILPFMGGVPAASTVARTSVSIRAGGQTRLTGAFNGLFLLASMFLVSPFISQIPLSALAGVLMVATWRMNRWDNIKYLFSRRFGGAMIMFTVTLGATVVFDLTVAIAAGMAIAIVLFVAKMTNLDLTVSEYDPSRMEGDLELPLQTEVVYITGVLFFGSITKLEKGLKDAKAQLVILSMHGVPSADVSAVQTILSFCEERKATGKEVAFACLNAGVKDMLDRGGVTDTVGEGAFYATAKDAIVKYSMGG